MKWKGSDGLRDLLVPVTDLHTHPDNPRVGDVTMIAASLREFGQTKPIVTWQDPDHGLVIVAGNHTYRAATEVLGWDEIAAAEVKLTPTKARAYLVADNRASDLGRYYGDQLAAILTDLRESGALDGTGYSGDDVDKLVADAEQLAADALAAAEPPPTPRERKSNAGEATAVLRDASLLLPTSQEGEAFATLQVTYRQFMNWIRMLKREYGTDGVAETVVECVRRAVKAL